MLPRESRPPDVQVGTDSVIVRLFKTPALCAMLIQNVLIGITFYGFVSYVPIYYQSVGQWSPILSAALMVPLV